MREGKEGGPRVDEHQNRNGIHQKTTTLSHVLADGIENDNKRVYNLSLFCKNVDY